MLVGKENLHQLGKKKTLVAFGAGEIALKTLNMHKDCFEYYLDNNPTLQGTVFEGKPVLSPEVLRDKDKSSLFVVICSEGYRDIVPQLEDMGLVEGEHFGCSILLENYIAYASLDNGSEKLLVTCCHGDAGLHMVNTRTGTTEKIESGSMRGMVLNGDEIIVTKDDFGLIILDKDSLEIKETCPLADSKHICGVACCPETNVIYVGQTGQDRIVAVDRDTLSVVNESHLSSKFHELGHEQHHLNDLWVVGDNIWVCMFSLSGYWRRGVFDGGIAEYDKRTFEKRGEIVTGMTKPHSLMMRANTLYFLNSFKGQIRCGTDTVWGEFPSFLRGLHKDDDLFYAGYSRHRHIEEISDLEIPKMMNSGIIVFNYKYNVYKFIDLHNVRDVYSIVDLS